MRCFFLFPFIFFAIQSGQGQSIIDKNKFAERLSWIFMMRGTGFDTIRQILDDTVNLKEPVLPGASECWVSSNYVFGAEYLISDSLQAWDKYKDLKALISYTAQANGISAQYSRNPYDPDAEYFVFVFPHGYNSNQCEIAFDDYSHISGEPELEEDDDDYSNNQNKKVRKKEYLVRITIGPGEQDCFFTNYGDAIDDPELKEFFQKTTFNTDTLLRNVTANKKILGKGFQYESKINLTGFVTKIAEYPGSKDTTVILETTRDFIMAEADFFKKVEDFILRMKSSLPKDYSFQYFLDQRYIEFSPSALTMQPGKYPSIILGYSKNEGQKESYRLKLTIRREKQKK